MSQEIIKRPTHKPHFCIYCKTSVKRIHEHFLRKHREEERIQAILCLTEKKRRYWAWKKLTQEGDYFFNTTVADVLDDKKIVMTPKVKSCRKKYFDCPNCLGRIRTCSKLQHYKMCQSMLKDTVLQTPSAEDVTSNATQEEVFQGTPEGLLNQVRKSLYVTKFLIHLLQERKNKTTVRTAITDLCTLESSLQKATGEKNKPLVSFFTSLYVDVFINVIKTLCEEKKHKKQSIITYPHKARRLCRLIDNLCKFLNIFYAKRDMNVDNENCSKFSKIFDCEATKFIKKDAYASIKLKKLENPIQLPQTSDILFVTDKLEQQLPELIEKLKHNKNGESWRQLAENLLCLLTIFNRRRGGAVEKLTIEQYSRSESAITSTMEETLYNLNDEDKEFLSNIRVIRIIHKCGNVVPIFIQKKHDLAIRILLDHRQFGQINPKNEYVFAGGKNSLNPIRGVKVIEKVRDLLPENKRKMFTATNLRKHGATTAQILNLSQEDTDEWATHLGHSVKVHKDYYRCEQQINSILKTGRILTALNKGTLKYYKGKKVDEITFGGETNNRASTSECLSTHKDDVNSTKANVVFSSGNPKASVSGVQTRSMKRRSK